MDSNGNYQFGKSGIWKNFLVSGYKLVGQGTGNGYIQLSGDTLDSILKGIDATQGFHNVKSGIQSYQSIAGAQS